MRLSPSAIAAKIARKINFTFLHTTGTNSSHSASPSLFLHRCNCVDMINFNHKKRETEGNIAITPIQNVVLEQFSVQSGLQFHTKLSNLHEIVSLSSDSTPALEKIEDLA